MHKELPPRCKEIAVHFLNNPHLKQHELAKHFGLSEGRISQVLRNPNVIKAFPLLARRILTSRMLPDAVQAYAKLVKQEKNLQVQEKAASTVLKQTGVFDAPDIKVQHDISVKPLAELQKVIENAKLGPNEVVDAEIVNESEDGLQ